MTDIVERLRGEEGELCGPLCDEAADEISQLRHEVEDLRKLVRHYEMELMRPRV